MNTEIQHLNESERKINIEMPQEETQKYFEEILKKEAKKLTVPGFRKGKAPLSLIKKMYGDALFYESLDKIAQNKFWDEMDIQGIEVVGVPVLTDLDLKEDGGLKFEIKFEVLPKIEIDNLEEIEVEKEEFEISEKFVEDYIEYIRFKLRKEELADEVESMEYLVGLEIVNQSEKSETSPTPENKILPIYLKHPDLNQEFVNLLIGKKLNDEFETSIPLTNSAEEQEKNSEEKKINHYKIVEIKKVILPEINDELAKNYTGGKIETLDELKKAIVEEELAYQNQEAKSTLRNSIKNAFIQKFNFTPPPSLVEKQRTEMEKEIKAKYKGSSITDEAQKFIKEVAERDVKWFLIREAIIDKYNLKLTNEEIDSYAQEIAEKYNQDKNAVLRYLQSNKSNLLFEKETDKFYDFILSKVKIQTKKVVI